MGSIWDLVTGLLIVAGAILLLAYTITIQSNSQSTTRFDVYESVYLSNARWLELKRAVLDEEKTEGLISETISVSNVDQYLRSNVNTGEKKYPSSTR